MGIASSPRDASRSVHAGAAAAQRVSRPRHYLNRRKSEKVPESLLDLLIQHYDELSRLVALGDSESSRPESHVQAGKPARPQTAIPSRS